MHLPHFFSVNPDLQNAHSRGFGCVRFFSVLLAALLAFFAANAAQAHNPNQTYYYFDVGTQAISGEIQARIEDLDPVFEIDADGDGVFSTAEIEGKADEINAAVAGQLSLEIDGTPVALDPTGYVYDAVEWADYLVLNFDTAYTQDVPETIEVSYDGTLPSQIEGHEVFVLLKSNARSGLEENEAHISLVFGAGAETQTLDLTPRSGWDTIWLFIEHGYHHILIGFDHIAFLIALLLPSVMRAREGQWEPVPTFRDALWNVLKIVTVFTVAHSVTLSLAALDIISLPIQPIEIAIALSIVAIAALNIFAVSSNWTYLAMFALGMLHGLGFANVLTPLGIEGNTLVQTLFAFNVGVELGQILIVLIIFPVLFLIRKWALYVPVVLRGGSALLILVAVYWFGERAIGYVGGLMA